VESARYAGFNSVQTYPLTDPRFGSNDKSQSKATGVDGLQVYWAIPMAMFLGEGAKNLPGLAPQQPRPTLSWLIALPESQPEFVHTLVLDSGGSQQPGGTGQVFDWHEAERPVKELSRHSKVVVAGGLTPMNVSQAIDILHPWGVDVVSGVEAAPGKKDPEKVRAFVRAVRETDRKAS